MKLRFNLPLLLIFTCFLMIFSCKKSFLEDNSCNVSNPLTELAWLKNIIENLEKSEPSIANYTTISMAKYNGETVFTESTCNPSVILRCTLMNCTGELLGYYYGDINPEKVTDKKVIWKSENSNCTGK